MLLQIPPFPASPESSSIYWGFIVGIKDANVNPDGCRIDNSHNNNNFKNSNMRYRRVDLFLTRMLQAGSRTPIVKSTLDFTFRLLISETNLFILRKIIRISRVLYMRAD